MKYLMTLLAACCMTVSVGCSSAVTDHNKDHYERGEIVVSKDTGQILKVYRRDRNRTYDDEVVTHYLLTELIGVNEEDGSGIYSDTLRGPAPAADLEKLQLEFPTINLGDIVRHKKTGLTGEVTRRYQGFDEWVYRVTLDKDFENYEETGYSPYSDPRKTQEWEESDILVLPVHREKKVEPQPDGNETTYYYLPGSTRWTNLELVSYVAVPVEVKLDYESPFHGRSGGMNYGSPFQCHQ